MSGQLVPQPARRRRRQEHQAALPGYFSVPDLSRLHTVPVAVGEGEELSTADKALANTVFIAESLSRLIEELGPALKKLKSSKTTGRTNAVVWDEYKNRFWADIAKWLKSSVLGWKGMGQVWGLFTQPAARRTILASFFEDNKLDAKDAALE